MKPIIIYQPAGGKDLVAPYVSDEIVWMSQQQVGILFDTSIRNVNIHIVDILKKEELQVESGSKDYLITATDGK